MFSDEELISQCKEYNALAQKALYQKYGTLLLGLCMRYTHNRNDADDIFQEGFIKILTKIDSFSWLGKGSLEAWMKRIMVNTALTYIRKSKKQQQTEIIDDLLSSDFGSNNDRIEEDETANEEYESEAAQVENANFTHAELLEALKTLPDDFKLVFNLHVIEGLKHEEIAERLNIKIRTSRSRLLRARKKIQKTLLIMSKQKMKVKV